MHNVLSTHLRDKPANRLRQERQPHGPVFVDGGSGKTASSLRYRIMRNSSVRKCIVKHVRCSYVAPAKAVAKIDAFRQLAADHRQQQRAAAATATAAAAAAATAFCAGTNVAAAAVDALLVLPQQRLHLLSGARLNEHALARVQRRQCFGGRPALCHRCQVGKRGQEDHQALANGGADVEQQPAELVQNLQPADVQTVVKTG